MDTFPSCDTCHKQFSLKGPTPYLLPCLHALCGICMRSAVDEVLTCSTCQRKVNLTETHRQKDVVREREIFHLAIQHCPTEILYTHEDDGNMAVCWCPECEEFLCEHCHTLHDSFKATRRHSVQEVKGIQPGKSEHEQYCRIHKNYPLDLWDKDCSVPICDRCKRSDHDVHDVVDIDVAADAAKSELTSEKKVVQDLGLRHSTLIQNANDQIKFMDETISDLKDKLNHTFLSLKGLADQREKDLFNKIKLYRGKTKTDLDDTTMSSQISHLRCTTTTDYIQKALIYCSKYDLLILKRIVVDMSQTCQALSHPDKLNLEVPIFSTEGLEKLKSTISSFGNMESTENIPIQRHLYEEKTSQTDGDYLADCEMFQYQSKKLQQMEIDLTGSEFKVNTLTEQKEQAEEDANDAKEQCKLLIKAKNALEEKYLLLKQTLDMEKRKYSYTVGMLRSQIEELGISPEIPCHLLKSSAVDMSRILQCPQLKFDKDRVNISHAHVNTNGKLVNKPSPNLQEPDGNRLEKYMGTSSTVPFYRCGSPQYWELGVRVNIDHPLTGNLLLLEIGLCQEDEQDQRHYIGGRSNSYSLVVAQCTTHFSICRIVWRHGKYVRCRPDTFPNRAGQIAVLNYGVVFDDVRHRIVFIDLNENAVLFTVKDADCSRPLWPMFGVHNPSRVGVHLSLVVGNDIDMKQGKKAVIEKALTSFP